MKRILLSLILIPLLGLFQSLVNAQEKHSISGTFSPVKDYTYAFLYYATPDGAEYVDRGQLDASGNFTIDLKEDAKTGIYKIVYAIPPEENNFDLVFNGKENVEFTFSLENGVNFKESSENKLWSSYLNSMEAINQTITNFYGKGGTDKEAFRSIFSTLKSTQKSYEDLAEGKLVLAFVKANTPYIPEVYEDLATYSKNLKANFFKHIDFNNPFLQSSTLISDRVTGFVFGLSANTDNTTFKQHVDIVANALNTVDDKVKSTYLELIWQEFKRRKNHDMANYVADSYLIEIAKATENKILEQMLISYKNTSIGAVAPDFNVKPNLRLSELKGDDYYVLIFWSSGCGHCLKELPKVKAFMKTVSNAKVVAYGLENNAKGWEKEIQSYPDFVHGIGLGKWENPMVQTYGIAATPTYFVLDTDKKIVAKPYDFEGLEGFFNRSN